MLRIILLLLVSLGCYGQKVDSCSYYKKKLDTTRHELYMANQQINAVKFYIKVCKRKPSNKKYFYGWISNRAVK